MFDQDRDVGAVGDDGLEVGAVVEDAGAGAGEAAVVVVVAGHVFEVDEADGGGDFRDEIADALVAVGVLFVGDDIRRIEDDTDIAEGEFARHARAGLAVTENVSRKGL